MIFYFSGTGNSLFAAKQLLQSGEELISIADALKKEKLDYKVAPGENVGFVFPVYFYTVPAIVKEFISKVKISKPQYVYAVITCGGGISQAGAVLKRCLGKRGMTLNYVTPLLMPDNSMLFYQIPPVDEAGVRIQDAKNKLAQVAETIKNRKSISIKNGTAISTIAGCGYKLCNKTKKFYADETCIGCGLCERNCPQSVIRMHNGKPEWEKTVCSKCSACINRCPVSAIQYGKSTIGRNRYVFPEMN